MNDIELEKRKYAASYLIEVADALSQQIVANDKVIENKRATVNAVVGLSSDVLKVLGTLKDVLRSGTESPEERLTKSAEVVDSIVNSLNAVVQGERNEVISLESQQSGIRKTLDSLRETAKAQLDTLEQQPQPKLPLPPSPRQSSTLSSPDLDWDDT